MRSVFIISSESCQCSKCNQKTELKIGKEKEKKIITIFNNKKI